jgi:outer membrane translocation and assembly module TamA
VGVNFFFMYDARRNPLRPVSGAYLNVSYRTNERVLGSDNNWDLFTVDARKYWSINGNRNKVFACWFYGSKVLSGKCPYMMLPATAGDALGNSGRGYPQGRFRSETMLYLEGEYRFTITRNKLIGGVVFSNLQTFNNWPEQRIDRILPAFGFGARLKLNKYSDTNIVIDYAAGIDGSQGLFLNLGEVF